MTKQIFVVAAVALMLGAPASSRAEQPERSGFTIKLSMGVGGATVFGNGQDSETFGGLGGLNVALGGFVAPDWAVLFKISGVNYGPFSDNTSTGVTGIAGPAVQYWLHDRVSLDLTAGLGFNVTGVDVPGGSVTDEDVGFGAVLGVGFSLLALKHHALGLYVDAGPVITGDSKVLTFQGGVAWQYH